MARRKVFVTRVLPQAAIDKIEEFADVEVWQDELPPPREVMLEKVRDLDGLLSMLTDSVDAELMDAAPGLRVVSNYAVGFDNIDVTAASARGIRVGNTPGVLTETTADLAFALLMASARRIAESDSYTRSGRWRCWGPMLFLGQDIHHATLGIIGLGRIGAEMAKRARGFDMKVLYYGTSRDEPLEQELGVEYADLGRLLSESDFVSLHVPLTDRTRGMIGQREFGLMKPTAILINTARGAVVDQEALYEALKSGRLAHAGLDVFEPEPPAPDDPLLSLPNVTLAPHIGSGSVATRTKMAMMAAENLLAGLRDEDLPNQVNARLP